MLRTATHTDLDFIYGLYMHPAINPYLLYEPMEPEAFRPIFDDLVQQQVLFVFEEGGHCKAMCKLVPQRFRNAHILYLGGVAVHPQHSGTGVGPQLMNSITAHAQSRGFRRIELSVATHNEKAIRLYRKAGFETEGVLRQFTYVASHRQYWDEMMMALLLDYED